MLRFDYKKEIKYTKNRNVFFILMSAYLRTAGKKGGCISLEYPSSKMYISFVDKKCSS